MRYQEYARRLAIVGGIAAMITVGACSKGDKPPAETTSVATPATAAPTPSPTTGAVPAGLSVVDVKTGKHIGADKQITEVSDTFAPGDSIYASVHTTGTATGNSIVGRWTFENGTTVHEDTQSISPTGDAYTEFHISKAGGWPKGKYTLHVLLDGKEVQTKDATVK